MKILISSMEPEDRRSFLSPYERKKVVSLMEQEIQEGKTETDQLENMSLLLEKYGSRITGAAVIWNALAAVARFYGFPLPLAPQGLGQ